MDHHWKTRQIMKPFVIALALYSGITSMACAQVLHLDSCEHALVLQYGDSDKPVLSRIAANDLGTGISVHTASDGVRMTCAPFKSKAGAPTNAPSSSSSITINGARINRAIGAGAVATQNIGGQSSTSRSEKPVSPVVISVPRGWRIQARNWAGSLTADSGIWQVDLEIAAGQASFAQLKDSRVIVDAGSLDTQSLIGRFDAHLRGAGSIEAERSNDAALHLQLTGAGSMTFKGRARSANIRASGVGSIEIEKLITEPQIQASSLATIDIGR
jgi:Putative auto-transporter adhesin, head GIN domain